MTIHSSRKKFIILLIFSLAMIVLSVFILRHGLMSDDQESIWAGIFNLIIFPFLLIFTMYQVISPMLILSLDEGGMAFQLGVFYSVSEVRWDKISNIGIEPILIGGSMVKYIVIKLKDDKSYINQQPPKLQKKMQSDLNRTGYPILIPTNIVNHKPEDLLDIIKEYHLKSFVVEAKE